ncbi:MAG: 4-alpha-glucanotransferase [Oscillospiraceae bacterium]|nr:4-alpha-glucanotransferase [Oscillospiraceae bacterium]
MRQSGILMHISSLPGPYGIGSMGKSAYEFVDFLVCAGQHYWQLLPLCPTGYGDSPYQSFSTFAGNPYLIDLCQLIEEGLLEKEEVDAIDWGSGDRVDYDRLYQNRGKLFTLACDRFAPGDDYDAFVADNAWWLEDYALFMALKTRLHGKPWQDWSISLMLRYEPILESMRQELEDDIRCQKFMQYLFFRQWNKLHSYAREKGISIIGDVPIYVPLDSADVWANQSLFRLDTNRRPEAVAGCPPDSFSADGQLWGNPLYDWEQMKQNGYSWWLRRLGAAANMYDVIRFDHFRGFESYWSIPAGETTAINGVWVKGPGEDFIRAVQQAFPDRSFIAEDLGFVTDQVRALQEFSGYPGMKVIQFACDSRESGDYLPHNYPVNSVCYSGTHDNSTLLQWFREADPADVQQAKEYFGLNQEEGFVWGMLRGCMQSVSKLCVVQLQDYLELDGSARMNVPGTLSKSNWSWRATPGYLTEELAQRIYSLTKRYGRL